jgi:hypothetical protein
MMVLPFLLLVVAALTATLGLRRPTIGVWVLAVAAMIYTLSLRPGGLLGIAL